VEGIVISRPVTPDSRRSQQTLVGSENDCLRLRGQISPGLMVARGQKMRQSGRPLVYQPSPYIALPVPVHRVNSGSSSLRSSTASIVSTPSGSGSNDASIFLGRRGLSDPLLQQYAPVSPVSYSASSIPRSNAGNIPDSVTLARLEGRFLPPSPQIDYLRRNSCTTHSSSNPSNRSQSRTPSPPDGERTSITLVSIHEDSTRESSRESDSSIENDGIEVPCRAEQTSGYLSPDIASAPTAYRYVPETAYGDLSLLHYHRLSHAAEVGQLLPRHSRTPRVLSGTEFINSPPPTPVTSPTMVHPVYAFDIDLRPTIPTAAVLGNGNPELTFSEQTGPYIEQSLQSGEAARVMEEVWNKSAEAQVVKKEIDKPPIDLKPEEKMKKALNMLRKKCVSKTTGSIGVDLEAQV